MAYTVGAIEVILRTDLDQFTGGMRRAGDAVDQATNRISRSVRSADQSVQQMQRSLGGVRGNIAFSGLAASALLADNSIKSLRTSMLLLPAAIGGTGLALGIKQLISYADAAAEVRNRIAVVTKAGPERVTVESQIFEIAQRTRTEYTSIAQLYARTAQSAAQLGRSQSDILRFTEAVAKTATISGARREEASAAAIQLAQGLASNRLQGDELRSVLENNVALAKILAEELAGGSVGRLREMGAEGLLSAQAVLDAVLRRQEDINNSFAQMAPTISQGFTVISNALTKYVGDLDRGIGVSKAMYKAMQSIADNLPTLISGFLLLGSVIPGALAGRFIGSASSGARSAAVENFERTAAAARMASTEVERANRHAQAAAKLVASYEDPKTPRIVLASAEATREYNRAVSYLIKTKNDLARAEETLAKAESGSRIGEKRLNAAKTTVDTTKINLPFAKAAVDVAGVKLLASATREAELASASLALAQHNQANAAARAAAANLQLTTAEKSLSAVSIASATSLSLLRNAGTSLFASLGGPWGAALTAITAGFLIYHQRVATAAAETERLKAVLKSLPAETEKVIQAQERAAKGIDARRDIIDAKQTKVDAEKAAGAAASEFFAAFFRLGKPVKVLLEDVFKIDLKHTSIDEALLQMHSAGKVTAEQIDQVVERVKTLAVSGGIDNKKAGELLKAAEAAKAALDSTARFSAELDKLDNRQVNVTFNVKGMELGGLPVIGGPLDQSLAEQATRDSEAIQARINDDLRRIEDGARAEKDILRLQRETRKAEYRAMREEEEKRAARLKYPYLPAEKTDAIARMIVDKELDKPKSKPTAEVDKYAKTMRELGEEATVAGLAFTELDRETLRYARAAGLSEAEAQKFIAAVSSGQLEAAPEKIRRIREQLEAIAKSRLIKDIAFDLSALGSNDIESAVATRLKGAGLTIDLSGPLASLLRMHEYLRLAKDLTLDFVSTFRRDMVEGKNSAEAFRNALGRIADTLTTLAEKAVISFIFKGITTGLGLPSLFDSGGVAGMASYGPRTRLNGPLPVFDSGGGARHYPALLERGERVLTEAMGRRNDNFIARASALAQAGGGGGVLFAPTVNVAMPAGAQRGDGERFGDEIMRRMQGMIDTRLVKFVTDQKRSGGVLAR